MVYNPNIRTAAQLTAQARAAALAAATGYALATYLPDTDNQGLSFNFDVNSVALNEKASYRSFGTESELGRTEGGANRAGKLPPISRKYLVQEFEQLSLYQDGQDAIGAELEKFARRVGAAIAARVELARGEGIENGVITIAERGLEFTIDFGRKAEHSVVAASLWSAAGSKPIDDLESWKGVYRTTNGANPQVTLLSGRIMATLQKNADIIAAALRTGANLPSRVSVDDVLSVLSSYGYGNVRLFDEVIGTERVISDSSVLFLPSDGGIQLDGGPLGTTEWGIPAESINAKYGISGSDRPGIFAASFDEEDPEQTVVNGSAIVLPVIRNANATFKAKVLA